MSGFRYKYARHPLHDVWRRAQLLVGHHVTDSGDQMARTPEAAEAEYQAW